MSARAAIDLREYLEDADWTKSSLDYGATDAEALRAELEMQGVTVEEFRKLPAYSLALESGRYDWLVDL